MLRRTRSENALSVLLRVMTSHFSGVVTMTWVACSSRCVSCMSPVSSLTTTPQQPSFSENFWVTSAARAFIGATYLKHSSQTNPWMPRARRTLF